MKNCNQNSKYEDVIVFDIFGELDVSEKEMRSFTRTMST